MSTTPAMSQDALAPSAKTAVSGAATGSEPDKSGASRRRVGAVAGSWPAVAWKKIFRASILFS
jgi:hypothetical protein